MTDLTSSLLGMPVLNGGGDASADPLDDLIATQRDAAISRRIREADADAEGRALRLAATYGLPHTVISTDLPGFEAQDRSSRAQVLMQKYPAIGKWSAQDNNAAIAADDFDSLGNIAAAFRARADRDKSDFSTNSGFLDRMGDLLKVGAHSLDQGAAVVRGALQDWSARNPLPWTSAEKTAAASSAARQARAIARISQDVAGATVAGETDWDTLKARPTLGNIGRFGLDQGVKSIPGMAQAALAFPLFVLGQAGSIGQTRANAQGREDANIQDVGEAAPAAVLSGVLERIGLHGIFGAAGSNALMRVGKAAATEAVTEFGQGTVEYIGGHSQTGGAFSTDEMLDQAFAGAVAGGLMGGGLRSVGEASRPVLKPVKSLIARFQSADDAVHDGAVLDQIGEAVGQSKLRERSPEAFAALIRQIGEDAGSDTVYIPADALQTYMQSDAYSGEFDSYRDAIDDAIVTGGDFVLPVEEAVAQMAATPAWDALKEDMRFSAGGMSRREAETFDEAMADVMSDLSDRMADADKASRQLGVPRDRLFQTIADKLMNAGFTPTSARQQAELLTQRQSTRAARMGRELVGDELDGLDIRQVLPPSIAAAQRADQLDITISVMQGGKDPKTASGPSLMDFIAKGGGIVDTGGDLKSMGADKWHVGKPGKRKLVRDNSGAGQESMLVDAGGLGTNEYGADAWAMRAWEAGYFPEFDERPSANDLLEAIGEGVAGRDRVLEAREKGLRDAAQDLRGLLENRNIDPDKANRADIRAAVDQYVADQAQGYGFDQSDPVATLTGDEIAPMDAEPAALRKAAKEWYKANLAGTSVFSEALGADVEFVGSGKKPISSSADTRKLRLFAALSDLVAHSVKVDTVADRHGIRPIKAWHYLRGDVVLDGEQISVTLSVREETDGHFYYNHVLEDGAAPQRTDPARNAGDGSEGSAYDQSIPENPDGINIGLNAGGADPRGRITFPGGQSAAAIIELFQSRDQSTFLHETGHLWLEELRDDAGDPGAPQQVRDDWQIVQDWFAAEGHPIVDGVVPVDAHELWARGFERYLMEGKAPSPGLSRIFQTVKAWLVSLYNSVSSLRSPISDDVRGVMDRLIATDEELADAIAAQSLEALFPEKPETMTVDEFAAYRRITAGARDAAHDALLAKTMNAIKRRVGKDYREKEAEVRGEVQQRIDALPEFRALRMMKAAPIDSQWVRDRFGEDATAMLPRQVPPIHREGGANPDEVAEMSGFDSAEEMIGKLLGVEIRRREMRDGGDKRSVRAALIDQETDQIMMDRYGDPFTDGSIAEEALAAVHSDQQGEVIAAELRVLARSTGDRVTPYSVAKDWASRQVRDGEVRTVASRSAILRYERAAAKAGKAAMEAVIKGDTAEAFRQKQAQMLNNALVAEARRAADEIDTAVARLEKWAKRRTVKLVDQDYLERAQALLEQVDMKPRTQRFIERRDSFEAWAEEQEANGHDIVVPRAFAASLGSTHWTRLSVDQLLGLDDAVKQIIHLGRLKQTLLDNKEEREFNEVVDEAVNGMGGMKQRPPSNLMEPSRWDDIKSNVAAFDASLLKMEQVFDWLDGGNSNGVFNRIVFKPLADAQERETAMLTDYHARIRAAFETLDAKQLRRWSERFSSPALLNRDTGQPYQMKREQLISMALNMGNAGNVQRLTDGYAWPELSVRDVLNRELTREDWQFVQQVWDIVETLWPQIAAMERRVNGIAPDKVDALPVETPTGSYRGGYFPAIYDMSKSYAAEVHAGKSTDLLETIYTRANTRASATKERSEQVKRPILLQLGVINRHLGEVVHDLTHREAVMQADKFLRSERIMRGVDDTLGPEIRKQFRPWLKYIANQWAMERAGNEGVGAWMQKLRSNATVVGMGFRFTTMLNQLAGYSNSFEYVGASWVTAALARTTAHPIDTFNFVMEKSGEVRGRMDTLDRDIGLTLKEMQGKKQVLTAAKRFAFHGIGYMDRVVVIPTWMGAYNKAQAAGMDERASIYAADKAVRLSQGSGSAKDLAAIARGTGKWGEALKLMTMFYSYMSAFYQRQRSLGRDIMNIDRAGDLPAILARAWWLIVVPPILAQTLSGNGPDDDDDWSAWGFKQMLFQSLGPIPGLRDLASPVWEGLAGGKPFDYQFTPMQRAFQSIVESARDIHKIWEGDDAKRPVRNAMEVAGYWTGLVPGQLATSTQFLVDVGNGEQSPDTYDEWYRGLTKGKAEDD